MEFTHMDINIVCCIKRDSNTLFVNTYLYRIGSRRYKFACDPDYASVNNTLKIKYDDVNLQANPFLILFITLGDQFREKISSLIFKNPVPP